MVNEYLTIKELTETVGGKMTPRMVRHYHQVGLLAQPVRSLKESSYEQIQLISSNIYCLIKLIQ